MWSGATWKGRKGCEKLNTEEGQKMHNERELHSSRTPFINESKGIEKEGLVSQCKMGSGATKREKRVKRRGE